MNATVRERHWLLIQRARWQGLPFPSRLYRIGLALLLSAVLLGALSILQSLAAATLLTGGGLCATSPRF